MPFIAYNATLIIMTFIKKPNNWEQMYTSCISTNNFGIKKAIELYNKNNYSREELMYNNNELFGMSCAYDNLEIVKWLHSIVNYSKNEGILAYYSCFESSKDSHTCTWLIQTFDLQEILQTKVQSVILSCNINNAEKIHEKFNLTRDFYTNDNNIILHEICLGGHLQMVKWLHEKCNFTRDEIINCDIFVKSCIKGHLNIAQWLHSQCIFTKNEIVNYGVFIKSYNQHPDVAKWIKETWDLNEHDVAVQFVGIFN